MGDINLLNMPQSTQPLQGERMTIRRNSRWNPDPDGLEGSSLLETHSPERSGALFAQVAENRQVKTKPCAATSTCHRSLSPATEIAKRKSDSPSRSRHRPPGHVREGAGQQHVKSRIPRLKKKNTGQQGTSRHARTTVQQSSGYDRVLRDGWLWPLTDGAWPGTNWSATSKTVETALAYLKGFTLSKTASRSN
jgi:hypothetical protein